MGSGMKACAKCGLTKALEEFSPHEHNKLGRQSRCKSCCRQDAAERRARAGATTGVRTGPRLPDPAGPGLKTCTKCRAIKPVGGFRKNTRQKTGLEPRCTVCLRADTRAHYVKNAEQIKAKARAYSKAAVFKRRAYAKKWRAKNPEKWASSQRRHWLKSKYGLTPEQWEEMFERQSGCCAICQTTEPRGHYNQFHVDHDHVTGAVRGLLCHDCNIMLGSAHDDAGTLLAAVDYLVGHGSPGILSEAA